MTLYRNITQNPAVRNSTAVTSILTAFGLQPVQDFEKTFARKLQPTDYYFNPQIGFISLNQQLQPDEVLAVAFEYTYNGKLPGGRVFTGFSSGFNRQYSKSFIPQIIKSNFATAIVTYLGPDDEKRILGRLWSIGQKGFST